MSNLKLALQGMFATIFVSMIAVTIWSGMQISLWDAWPDYKQNPWAIATLFDAYFGFLTFFVWVCYKERSNANRFLWFVLIMALGNIAMALYVLIQLSRLKPGGGARELLGRS